MINHVLVIRTDEINTKGKNRYKFELRLAANLAHALHLPVSQFKREQGQLYVIPDSSDPYVLEAPTRVFGVKNFSPAVRVDSMIEAIDAQAIEAARQEALNGARTFKVKTRRGDKKFSLNSMEINARLGEIILQAVPELSVNVREPDFQLRVEVRKIGTLLSTRIHQGPGGLPVGINGKALLLLSGGIDSPVAGWMAMKRGLALDAIYFHSPPYTSEKAKEKVLELARILSRWKTAPVSVYIVPLTEIQLETSRTVHSRFWTLIHRRFMHRLAERIAISKGYNALITGESLGQVASQTLNNIGCIDRAVQMLILRPLIGFDKLEIIAQAQHIGTYETSQLPYEDCCSLFAPKDPLTNARIRRVEYAESKLDVDALISRALEQRETVTMCDP